MLSGTVIHAYAPGTQKAEAGGLHIPDQRGLELMAHIKIVSQTQFGSTAEGTVHN